MMIDMHYIPAQSYGKYPEEFEETFLWCKCYYNPVNDLLAVDGCYWACPYSLIVLDFSHPMTAVEAEDWADVSSTAGTILIWMTLILWVGKATILCVRQPEKHRKILT